MSKYKICPRCELNWIKEEDELCDVCKAQLSNSEDLFTDEEDEQLCPLCKTNYIEPGEKYCADCLEKRRAKGIEDDDSEAAPDAQETVGTTIEPEDGIETVSFDETIEEEESHVGDESYDDSDTTYQADLNDTAILDNPIDDDDFIPVLDDDEVEEEEDDEDDLDKKDEDDLEDDFKIVVDPSDFMQDEEEDEMQIRRKKLKENKDDDE